MVIESIVEIMHKAEMMESPEMLLSDDDVENINKLELCMFDIYSKRKEEGEKSIYDNRTLNAFMVELSIMIDDIKTKKNIKNFISHVPGGPRFGIDVRVKYEE